ncbi:glycosyl transferase family 28 [Pokkaliibacter plantistimulans]|uniref:Glycosyl transferase family 28 n=1 Tax=Proteobacteria bacterium 228 TaxID=2083153 RepID=A0A2S5KWR3_9PROT|nr:glycosyltransferase [Pokkaliibacter plantistimulans]PPC78939.1 glycosyl transferase family 28 [Pokkaliibacter plantistimulans]
MRVMFYVQHLLGIGHIKRAAQLSLGMQQAGLEVWVVQGGEAVAGIDFGQANVISLPAIRAADAQFSGLVDEQGKALDDDFKANRRALLLQALEQIQPDALLIESYPFGRGQLRFELDPLLQQAHSMSPRPLILSSARDILQRRPVEKEQKALKLLERYFDGVLVHGQQDFVPLTESFSLCDQLSIPLHYTGYVTDTSVTPAAEGQHEVIVSAGGGAVGLGIMQAALLARPLTVLREHRWRVLIGPNLPADQIATLQLLAADGVILEPIRSDFRGLLANAALSISQGGYNTLMDILLTGVPSVIVPFEGKGETEQITRTAKLEALGICAMVREQQLQPEHLARVIDQTVADLHRRSPELSLQLAGARRSGDIIRTLLEQRHG